jgi:hypothetical protein
MHVDLGLHFPHEVFPHAPRVLAKAVVSFVIALLTDTSQKSATGSLFLALPSSETQW